MTVSECADPRNVNEFVKAWPEIAREAATTMIGKYGPPNEACAGRLVWHNNGSWRHTVVYRDEVEHNFPTPHRDGARAVYSLLDKFNDLAVFDE